MVWQEFVPWQGVPLLIQAVEVRSTRDEKSSFGGDGKKAGPYPWIVMMVVYLQPV